MKAPMGAAVSRVRTWTEEEDVQTMSTLEHRFDLSFTDGGGDFFTVGDTDRSPPVGHAS